MRPLLLPDTPTAAQAYVWMALGTLLLLLLTLALAYLIARRNQAWLQRLVRHDVLRRVDTWLARRLPGCWAFIRRRFTLAQWHGLELTATLLILFLALLLFAFITEGWVDRQALYRIDQAVHQALAGALTEGLVDLMRLVTHLGDFITVLALSVGLACVLLYRGHRWRVLALVLVTPVGGLLLWGLKWIFARTRPGAHLTWALGHSFPSGHAFTSTAFYGLLIFLLWRTVRGDAVRIPATIALVLLIFTIGMSRVLLSVHWVSDVIGGFTVGLAWLICSLLITRVLQAYTAPAAVPPDDAV